MSSDAYLGTAAAKGDVLVIRGGFVGRPTLVPPRIVGLAIAVEHEAVAEDDLL